MDESKEERRKRLARERAKRIYEEKKETILAYKKDKYAETKAIPKEQQQKRGRKPIDKNYSTPSITKKTKFTQDELISLINTDDEIKSDETKKFHTTNIKRFFRTTECEDLSCLKTDYKLVFDRLANANNSFTGETLLPTSIKHTLKTLLLVFNRYAGDYINPKIKEYLQDKINQYILQSADYYDNKQQTEIYPTFEEYLNKTISKYGSNSKQYLVAKLYSELTIRDNFGNAPVLEKSLTSNEINYFVMKKNYIYFILNDYKTADRYDTIRYTFSSSTNKLIRQYMTNNNIQIGDILFEGNLSAFVSNMNKELGYENLRGINIFRHIRVSELQGSSYEEKVKLSKLMGHAVLTQNKYRRKLEIMP